MTDLDNATQDDMFMIKPRFGGLANDTQIMTTDHKVLYHVKSKPFSPLGRVYQVLDDSQNELMTVEQDHTAIFPRYSIIENGKTIGKVGQQGLLPQLYFIQLSHLPKMKIHLGGASSVFSLHSEETDTAKVELVKSTWMVTFKSKVNTFHILSALAVIYRENTVGG